MIKDKELLKERVTAILLWGIPWGIVVAVLATSNHELNIDSFVKNGSIGILLFIALCYIASSIYSFVGFVWPLFVRRKKDEWCYILKPHIEGVYSDSAKKLLKLLKNGMETERLCASCIVIHDFLLDYKERGVAKEISSYIPSVMQMRKYPYESLCMMLSSEEKLKTIDTDKYYNFELVLNTCLFDTN